MSGTFLLEDQTTNTTGNQSVLKIENTANFAKWYNLYAHGIWDGATIITKISPDEGTTWDEAGEYTTFTQNGGGRLLLNPGFLVRGDLSDAGALTNLNLKIF